MRNRAFRNSKQLRGRRRRLVSAPLRGLGIPPAGFRVRWPTLPTIIQDVTVTTLVEFNAAALVPGNRISVQGNITGGDAVIDASDIEVRVGAGFSVDRLFVAMENSRIHVNGGAYGEIELQQPIVFFPEPAINEAWFIHDALIEGVDITAPASGSALKLRGKRVAVVNCNITTENYGIWVGDTTLDATVLQTEDLIVLNNTIVSTTGTESTIRLQDALRSAVVGNYLENHVKHNYRVHTTSDLAWCEGNILVDGGIMIANASTDTVGTVWFLDNELYHQTVSGVFVTSTTHDTYTDLFIRDNILYSDTLAAFPGDADPSITASNNTVLPAVTAPTAPTQSGLHLYHSYPPLDLWESPSHRLVTLTWGQADPQGGTRAVVIADDSVTGPEYIRVIPPDPNCAHLEAGVAYEFVWVVKQDEDETRFPEFQIRGDTGRDVYVNLNTRTGDTALRQNDLSATLEAELVDGWWHLRASMTWTVTEDVEVSIHPAIGTVIGVQDTTATGSITFYKCEVYATV